MTVIVKKAADGKLQQEIRFGKLTWYSDVTEALGGDDLAPDPHDLLDSALGACTALTITMYARRKGLPLQDVIVHIERNEAGGVYHMQRRIELVGDLAEADRLRLIEIANKCPVHKTLSGQFAIETTLLPPA